MSRELIGSLTGFTRGALAVALARTLCFGERLSADPPPPAATKNVPAADERVQLGGHVLPALARAKKLPRLESAVSGSGVSADDEPITITLVLRRDDEEGFQRLLQQL